MRADRPSLTAEGTALQRATERLEPAERRILDDPWAERFLGPSRKAALAALSARGRVARLVGRGKSPPIASELLGLTPFVVCRHRYIDDRLAEALDDGVEQVVVLGAGYDSRAFRFAERLRARPVFEVDHPATQGRKLRLLAGLAREHRIPEVDVRRIAIDFERDSLEAKLEEGGYRRELRTFVIWEGVSMYLTRAAVNATLATVSRITPPGSEIALDAWFLLDDPHVRATAHRVSASLLHLLGEPVTFSLHPEDAGAFLARHGMSVLEVADSAELERRYVRGGARRVYPACYLLHARRV